LADNFPKETRSKIMKSIKSKTKLEDKVCREIWHRGIRFRRNVPALLGKPDIAIKKYKLVVFLDSCFWHVCPIHGHIPHTNQDYWIKKLERNQKRDLKVTEHYRGKGWAILRFWEHEIKEDIYKVIEHIVECVYLLMRLQKGDDSNPLLNDDISALVHDDPINAL